MPLRPKTHTDSTSLLKAGGFLALALGLLGATEKSPSFSPGEFGELEIQCHQASLRSRQAGLSSTLGTDHGCDLAIFTGEKKAPFSLSYRHMDFVVHSAFFGPTRKIKEDASKALLGYQCENDFACFRLRKLLEQGIAQTYFSIPRDVLARTKKALSKLDAHELSPGPSICTKNTTAHQISEFYSLYCPNHRAAPTTLCATLADKPRECTSSYWLKVDTKAMDPRVRSIESKGAIDCQSAFTVSLRCRNWKKTKNFKCSKSGDLKCR